MTDNFWFWLFLTFPVWGPMFLILAYFSYAHYKGYDNDEWKKVEKAEEDGDSYDRWSGRYASYEEED